MADTKVTVIDNSDNILTALGDALPPALEICALVAEGYAARLCPVDTGRLRASISHAVVPEEKAAYIGTNVEYAPYVEFGTVKTRAQPFLRPAVADHVDQYNDIIKKALKG